jgi:hypothetical protein
MNDSTGTEVKRVLVLAYSQSGQLTRIIERIVAPLKADPGIAVHVEVLRPVKAFPFPWSFFSFLDAFPESAHLIPPELEPLMLRGDENFDLVILPYQVWFLAPSQPVAAFLKHPLAKKLLADRPVVTVIACRNMWMMAQEKVKDLLNQCGARLIDNVVLTDKSPTLVSVITTPYWLLTGRQERFMGLPAAGISEPDISNCRRFGLALRDALHDNAERGTQPLLRGLQACDADPHLYVSERAGTRSFHLWGKLLRAMGEPGQWRRRPFLMAYVVFLILLILTVVPLSLSIQALLRPMLGTHLAALKQRFDAPSGSGAERMKAYEH